MRTRGFLFLVGMISVVALSAPACTPSDSDDDDDGFGTTGTPTATPTGTGTATPTPTPPAQPITEHSSFLAAGGTELWLCYEAQFDGTIDNITTDEGGACSDSLVGVGVTATVISPTFQALRITGLTGCTTGPHDWYFDYIPIDDRCVGGDCVAEEYIFALDAADAFGTLCGSSGAALTTIVTDMGAYLSMTTGKHRFHVTTGQAGSVSLSSLLVYDVGGTALQTECTANATIVSNGTGLFDATCAPDVTLTPGVDYEAMISGTVGGESFFGSIVFDYETTPTPP